MADQSDSWAWELYWQGDRTACCLNDGPHYAENLAALWRPLFTELEDGAKLLDLCTGNGAIAMMAKQDASARGIAISVSAVDYANINPAHHVKTGAQWLQGIEFQGGVDCTALPFDDGVFDAATSNFGIEYADLRKAGEEAIRILSPGGRFQFILHAVEGTAARDSRTELQAIIAFEQKQLFDLFRRALDNVSLQNELQSEILKASKEIEHEPRAALVGSLTALSQGWSYRARFGAKVLLDQIAIVEEDLTAHRQRLTALLDAAKTAADCEAFLGVLKEAGAAEAELSPAMMDNPARQIGWRITGRR